MNLAELERLQAESPAMADRIDIQAVKLDKNASAADRAEQYLRQIKNPYAYRCGDIAVNVRFTPGERTLAQSVQAYLTAKAGG